MTFTSRHPAFRHAAYRRIFAGRALHAIAQQAVVMTISQAVYEATHSPFDLGLVGLTVFLARLGFTLPAGQAADRFDKRRILIAARALNGLFLALIYFTLSYAATPLALLYPLLFFWGITLAYDDPAAQSLVPEIVPVADFPNAVTWNSMVKQIAVVTGPLVGGVLYVLSGGPRTGILAALLMEGVGLVVVSGIPPCPPKAGGAAPGLKTLFTGLHYLRHHRLLLGVLSLDLCAVLLGGAVALMPIFANEILKVGPIGLGALRAAPSFGSAVLGLLLASRAPMQRAGPTLLFSVGLFGAFTILFGLSQNFWFSLFCLAALGAADMVSMIVRGVLVQLKTPPEMRGRVSAVNLVFIGASNELGEFESGLTATWFGTVGATVIGGSLTILVVLLWAVIFPEIRKLKKLH